MQSVVVRTKEELEHAQKVLNATEIFVEGELAKKLKKGKKVATASKWAIGVITGTFGVAAVAAPFTGGVSLVAAAVPIATITGLEIAAIIAAVAVGIALIVAVFKGYEEIEYCSSPARMRLRRKSSNRDIPLT